MNKCIGLVKPDIVHVHNVFPLISPSVLSVCHDHGIPVVMSVHNYRLICPNGLHMPKGRHDVCERCRGGHEYWCVLRNCERNLPKSLGYALRSYVARRLGLFKRNVTMFACLTDFQRRWLIAEGYPADHLRVIPNMYPSDMAVEVEQGMSGDYVAYAGRISPEKGIGLLLSAAEGLPDIPFRLAGSNDMRTDLTGKVPASVSFVGTLERKQLAEFYSRSRLLILCSEWFEGFPMVIAEAMLYGKAVIASRIGGIPEIVEDGRTGLLFTPGDVDDLMEKVRYLWQRPSLCRQMGETGREKALHEYSPERYYSRLMTMYKEAIDLAPRKGE